MKTVEDRLARRIRTQELICAINDALLEHYKTQMAYLIEEQTTKGSKKGPLPRGNGSRPRSVRR